MRLSRTSISPVRLAIIATLVGATLFTQVPGSQAQSSQCVRIAGVENSGQKESMDPADFFSGDDGYHINQVYNRLMDRDDNFTLKPELAESWSSNTDATEWTFKLRKGVKFHDGHELTSKDVVYTFKRLIDPARA